MKSTPVCRKTTLTDTLFGSHQIFQKIVTLYLNLITALEWICYKYSILIVKIQISKFVVYFKKKELLAFYQLKHFFYYFSRIRYNLNQKKQEWCKKLLLHLWHTLLKKKVFSLFEIPLASQRTPTCSLPTVVMNFPISIKVGHFLRFCCHCFEKGPWGV
jgi:hypothetical protein